MKMPAWNKLDLRQKPNRREKIIFALTLAVFFGAFVKSCWIPSRKAISDLKNQIRFMEQEKSAISSTPGKEIAPPVERETAFGDSVKEMEGSLGRLSQTQVLKGVRLQKSRFAEEERQGNWVRRRVELELTGSFQAIGRYLNTLESWPAPLWIETFSMKTRDDKLTANITGSFYGRK